MGFNSAFKVLRWPHNAAASQYEGKWEEFVFCEALNCQDLTALVMDEWETSNGVECMWKGKTTTLGKNNHISVPLCPHWISCRLFQVQYACCTKWNYSRAFYVSQRKIVKTWKRLSLQLQISGWIFTLPQLLYYRILRLFVNVHYNVCKLSVCCGYLFKYF